MTTDVITRETFWLWALAKSHKQQKGRKRLRIGEICRSFERRFDVMDEVWVLVYK